MNRINFFKLQAKNLLKDFKTAHKVYQSDIDDYIYEFSPIFFDVDEIYTSYELSDEEVEKYSLMKAQHFIAQLVGFNKWNDLIKSTEDELEIAKLLFDNQNKLSLDDWKYYLRQAEQINGRKLSSKESLAVLKDYYLNEDFIAAYPHDYRLK
ncbi:hypothetical protein [Bacteriovorax sp. Seq25_V]|uniref:hypothetical protein n=1 Tax=Bacteriovorax sp. Seq25_V TaxID=1201288 RepID=UPI00038A3BFE|nr:hypothetical protein [Bacteriovorax sp. Seq25_V]EQC47255.1 hypothetical protein M900_0862 [Bacteriovorax sp. Seq25_V]